MSEHEPSLSVVMPVFNEEGAVEGVVRSWVQELDRIQIGFELLVYDDGSVDRTPEILNRLGLEDRRIRCRSQQNRGHGPTVLRGYREARGEWVLQVDSDGEIEPHEFEALWRERLRGDFWLGYRQERNSPRLRQVISILSRWTVRALFGRTVRDVNCPYRLMRRSSLQALLAHLPAETFAPNVALSGLALVSGVRLFERPIRHHRRHSGEPSLKRGKLLRAAGRSFLQTVAIAGRLWRVRLVARWRGEGSG